MDILGRSGSSCFAKGLNSHSSRRDNKGLGGLVLFGVLALAGCQGVVTALVTGTDRLSGTVVAGQEPVVGAKVQLYAAGGNGDGSAATPLFKAPVSTSSTGAFDITGAFSCPSASAQLYLVATAGNPGLTLMKALGSCGSLAASTNLDINDVTTVASTFTLTPYMKGYSAVGSTAADAQAMVSAFRSASAVISTTGTSNYSTVVATNQTASAEKLRSLASILASCVSSTGSSNACGTLFSMAAAATYVTPTDTVEALLDIARDPAINVMSWSAGASNTSTAVQAPAFSTSGGTYTAAQTVAISSATAGATIYYTANGSAPTSASTIYTSPIKVSSTETLQAIAVLGDSNASPVTTAAYVINLAQSASSAAAPVKARAVTNAQTGTQTTTVTLSGSVQTAGIDRPGVNIGGLGGYGSQQLFKSLNYVNGGYFPGSYAATTYSCRAGGSNTTTTWYNDVTHPNGYPANYWVGATFDAINAASGTSYGTGTITASTSNTGATGITFSLSPAISSACSPNQNDVMIVRLTKQNTLLSPYQELNQHVCTDASWNTTDTSPQSGNTQQSLQMPNGCGLTFYIDATVTNRTNTNSSLASQQTPYLNLSGSYNATFKAKCLTTGCSINFSLGRLGGTTFVGNTTVTPASNGASGAGWTTYNYPFTASENGTQAQTIGYSFTCTGSCLMQDADVIEGSTLAGNTTVFRDAVVYELQKIHPGSIRYMDGSQWCSDVADQIATTGNRRWCGASNYTPGVGQGIGYNDVLALANFIGSDALISVGQLNTPAEWKTLINWLSSSGWTSTFAQSGHTIYLEDGNEAWNSGVGATLYFGNGMAYGYTLGPNMAAAKAASGYNANVIKLVGNSWVAGNQGYGPFGWVHNTLDLAKKTPNGLPDFVDLAPYMLNYLANFDTSGSNVAATGAPFLDEWAENANLDSVTTPPSNSESMYLNQQFVKSNYGVNTLVYEVNFSTLSGTPATQLQLDQIGASVGNALATSQHALLMQRDSGIIGPIHVFTLAEPYTGYSCNGCNGSAVMPLWGINHLMGTGPGQTPGSVTADRPLAIALQVINNAIGSNNNLMSISQTGTPTFSYSGGQPQGSSNTILPNNAVPYVNCFSYSNGASAWTVVCFNNNLTTPETVSLTGAGAPTGSVSQTIFPGPSNVITDHNENTFLGAASQSAVVNLPSPSTTSGTTYTIPPASMITLTYSTNGSQTPTLTLASPGIAPGTGTYTGTQTVNITYPAGSTVCVGINTTPTAPTAGTCGSGGSPYTGPITVSSSQTINAIATMTGSLNSPVASAALTITTPTPTPTAATPVFSVAPGTYTTTQSVNITDTTVGAVIYYTTNGTTPTTSSTLYNGAVSIAASQTLQAIAVANGYNNSAVASAAYTITPVSNGGGGGTSYINLSSGQFASSAFYLNGGASANGALQITDGNVNQVRSAWFNTKVPVDSFTTDFTFQLLNARADGMTFTIQNQSSSALGTAGPGLGYQGITNSVAVKFDLFNNSGEGINSTGLYTGGATPTTPFTDLTPSGINLHSSNILRAHIVYDGTNLSMTLTDTVTGTSTIQTYPVNIPAIIGSTTAYVGFTGSTGTFTANQNILTWSYTGGGTTTTPTPTPTAATPVFSVAPGTYTTTQSVNITDTTVGAVIYYTTNGTTPTTSSTLYNGAVSIAASQTLQAIAVANGYNNSAVASAAYTITPVSNGGGGGTSYINLSSGQFASSAFYLNGGASANGALQITDGNVNQVRSAWFNTKVPVDSFTTDFTFQLLNARADGMTFTIQNQSSSALGTAGPGLGYQGITNSVAVKFDLFNNSGEGINSTGLYTGGATPTTPFTDLTPSGINLHSSNILRAHIVYDGTNLSMTLTDTVTGTSTIQTYPVNIPAIIGSTTAYVGFTGSTGTFTANQNILTWSYTGGGTTTTPTPTPTAATPVFSVAPGTYTTTQSVNITDTTVGAVIYYTTNGTTPTTSSTLYNGAVSIAASQTLQAIAVANGYNNSAVASAAYTINISTPTTPSNPGTGNTYINFASGKFTASSLFLNGSPTVSAGGVLQVTDGRYGEQSAAWYNTRVPVGNFTNDFDFQIPYNNGDGMTFAIQAQGPTALGDGGSGLGYQGIKNSVALKFDLYDNGGEGINSTGLYINGASPLTPAVDLSKTGIDLHSGHIIHAHMVYDGSNLTMTLTDTVTNGTAVRVFPVNIPAIVGSSTAYVGFTGGTGGVSASQNVLTWSYTSN